MCYNFPQSYTLSANFQIKIFFYKSLLVSFIVVHLLIIKRLTMENTPTKLEDCDFRITEQYISKPPPNDDPDDYEDIDTED